MVFTATPLMPPLIGAVCFLISAALNLLALSSTLPNGKEWAWEWFASAANKKKEADQGGKVDDSFQATVLNCPCRTVREAFEKGTLGRVLFLTMYFALNVVLFFEAAMRHGRSNKGLALRGEPFWLCLPPAGAAGPCPTDCNSPASCNDPTAVQFGPIPLLQAPGTNGGVGAGTWFPIAKGFGQLLNLNCAIMILPVFRTAVRWLHDVTANYQDGFLG